MYCDKLNVFIIAEIYYSALKKEETTTWKIARKFNWEDKPLFMNHYESDDFYSRKTTLIGRRLAVLAKEGFVEYSKPGKARQYKLLTERVKICKHKFNNKFGDYLALLNKNNLWSLYEF